MGAKQSANSKKGVFFIFMLFALFIILEQEKENKDNKPIQQGISFFI